MIKNALKLVPCLLAASFFVATPAHAGDVCKNVLITVVNDRTVEIKVTKIEYYDYDAKKWREEAGIDRKIDTGKDFNFLRSLEHVKDDDTKIRITYRDHEGGTRWGSERTETTTVFACSDGGTKTIHAD